MAKRIPSGAMFFTRVRYNHLHSPFSRTPVRSSNGLYHHRGQPRGLGGIGRGGVKTFTERNCLWIANSCFYIIYYDDYLPLHALSFQNARCLSISQFVKVGANRPLAEVDGIEPSLTESKSVAVPFGYTSMCGLSLTANGKLSDLPTDSHPCQSCGRKAFEKDRIQSRVARLLRVSRLGHAPPNRTAHLAGCHYWN